MSWMEIVVNGAAGLLSAFVVSLFIKEIRKNRWTYGIAVGLLFVIFKFCLGYVFDPLIQQHQIESEMRKYPHWVALKKYQEREYRQLVSWVMEQDLPDMTPGQFVGLVRDYASPLIMSHVVHSSDDTIVRFLAVNLQASRELQEIDPLLCADWMNPRPGFSSLPSQKLPTGRMEEVNLVLAAVIETSAKDPQPIPTEGEVSDDLQQVFGAATERYADDIWMILDPHNPDADPAKICAMQIAIWEGLLTLPKERCADLFRFTLVEGMKEDEV